MLSPRKERLKLANQKVSPEGIPLIDLTGEDDDDYVKYILPDVLQLSTIELNKVPDVMSEVENGQESNSKNEETAISKRKVVVTTPIDVDNEMSTKANSDYESKTKVNDDHLSKMPMPTKAQQKYFESPQQKQLQPMIKRCEVRVRRVNLLEVQQMPPKQTISEDTNRISRAMSNGTLIDTPLDQPTNSKRFRSTISTPSQKRSSFIKLRTSQKRSKGRLIKPAAHCHLVKTFGKRFFSAYVHIQRSRQLSVLTIESNERACKWNAGQSKAKKLSVSFKETVEVLGDDEEDTDEDHQETGHHPIFLPGQIDLRELYLGYVRPPHQMKMENGNDIDDVILDDSPTKSDESMPIVAAPRKSYVPLKDDTTSSPPKKQLKLANEKVSPEGILLIDLTGEDDDDYVKYILPDVLQLSTIELNKVPDVMSEVENGQESISKNEETAISKRKVVVTTPIDVDNEMSTKANSDYESKTKVNDDHLSKMPMPTKAQQKYFESPQQKQLQPMIKRCEVRVRRVNLLEVQQMPPKQTISEDTNRISSAMSNGTLIDTPLDQPTNSKRFRSTISTPSQKRSSSIKLRTSQKRSKGRLIKPAAHCHLVKTFGKRFFSAYVHIQRSRQLSVLTIESNERACKWNAGQSKAKKLSVSFKETVEVLGDDEEDTDEDHQETGHHPIFLPGQIDLRELYLGYVRPPHQMKMENGNDIDDVILDDSPTKSDESTPIVAAPCKSYVPLKDDTTSSPPKDQLKLASEKVSPEGILLIDLTGEDDDDYITRRLTIAERRTE